MQIYILESEKDKDGHSVPKNLRPITEVAFYGPTDRYKYVAIWKGPEPTDGWQVTTDGDGQLVEGHVPVWLDAMLRPISLWPGKSNKAIWVGAASGLLTLAAYDRGFTGQMIEIEWDKALAGKMREILKVASPDPLTTDVIHWWADVYDIMSLPDADVVWLDFDPSHELYEKLLLSMRQLLVPGGIVIAQADFGGWPASPKFKAVFPEGEFYEDSMGWRFFTASV